MSSTLLETDVSLPVRRRDVGTILAAAALAVALLGVGATTAIFHNQLVDTQATLAQSQAALGSTQASLAQTQSDLGSTQISLTQAQSDLTATQAARDTAITRAQGLDADLTQATSARDQAKADLATATASLAQVTGERDQAKATINNEGSALDDTLELARLQYAQAVAYDNYIQILSTQVDDSVAANNATYVANASFYIDRYNSRRVQVQRYADAVAQASATLRDFLNTHSWLTSAP